MLSKISVIKCTECDEAFLISHVDRVMYTNIRTSCTLYIASLCANVCVIDMSLNISMYNTTC